MLSVMRPYALNKENHMTSVNAGNPNRRGRIAVRLTSLYKLVYDNPCQRKAKSCAHYFILQNIDFLTLTMKRDIQMDGQTHR